LPFLEFDVLTIYTWDQQASRQTKLNFIVRLYTRAIWKVTSGELLKNKQWEKTFLLYTKNKYILKLLLNIVTAWIEALVLGNKFLCACVKEVCGHWAQPCLDTFHQLLIIVEPILSKTCDSLLGTVREMCGNSHKISEIFLINFEQDHHYRWLTTSLLIVNICSPIFEHSTPLSYSSFTHYILAVNCSWQVYKSQDTS
jgi:hypothetical protein